MMERFEAILELTGGWEGTIGHAGQIEELLVAEVRELGHRAMQDWAVGAEARAAERLPREVPGTRIYKKALSWWCCYGSVTIQERIWQAPGRDYLRVFSTQAGIRARGKSQRLQRAMSDFGAEHSFGKSCQRIKEHYGFAINATAVRETTLEHAGRAREPLEAHYEKNFRELPRKGPAVIVAQTDGTMICTVAAGRAEACYAAGFTSVEQTGRRLAHCARDAGWALASRLHVVADGAEWIRLQTREVLGDQGRLLVDFYPFGKLRACGTSANPSPRPPPSVPEASGPGCAPSKSGSNAEPTRSGAHQDVFEALSRFYKLHNQTCHFPQSCCAAG